MIFVIHSSFITELFQKKVNLLKEQRSPHLLFLLTRYTEISLLKVSSTMKISIPVKER